MSGLEEIRQQVEDRVERCTDDTLRNELKCVLGDITALMLEELYETIVGLGETHWQYKI